MNPNRKMIKKANKDIGEIKSSIKDLDRSIKELKKYLNIYSNPEIVISVQEMITRREKLKEQGYDLIKLMSCSYE